MILLRAVGIPARWSIGYAQGELLEDDTTRGMDAEELTFIVRHKDAHAWPEVYFPTIGWVEFEPTAAQPEIVRVADDLQALEQGNLPPLNRPNPLDERGDGPGDQNPPAQPPQSQQNTARILYIMGIIILDILLIIAGGLYLLPYFGYPALPVVLERILQRAGLQTPQTIHDWARRVEKPQRVVQMQPVPLLLEKALRRMGVRSPQILQRWARWATLPPLAKAYTSINQALVRLGQPPSATDTPSERAANLSKLAPATEKPAYQLVQEYQIATFSQRPANLQVAQQSAKAIQRLTLKASLQRLLARWQTPDRPKRPMVK